MAVEVKRKNNESVESMLRRFTKRVQQSGVVDRAKKARFFEPSKSKLRIREEAIRRKLMGERKEYLRKVGKLVDSEDFQSGYRQKYGIGQSTQTHGKKKSRKKP
jgi:ribosomal protein S21